MRNAVRTIMAEFAVDLDTALDWVNSASGMTALAMDDEPRGVEREFCGPMSVSLLRVAVAPSRQFR
jgi:hypothetical protein